MKAYKITVSLIVEADNVNETIYKFREKIEQYEASAMEVEEVNNLVTREGEKI